MVAVLDAWTSAPGDGADRRGVFRARETLQLNAVFVTERDRPSRIEIVFLIEGEVNLAVTSEAHNYDLIFRPQLTMRLEATVGSAAAHAFATFLIPEVSSPLPIPWLHRERTTLELARGGFDVIFGRTLYRFRALTRMLDAATGLSFDLSDPAPYLIVT